MVTIHTIGHSNTPLGVLLRRLRKHDIAEIIDVRSYPRSRFVPHFDRDRLSRACEGGTVAYRFMGDSLGGKPGPEWWPDGKPDYELMAARPEFQSGMQTLVRLAAARRVAVMCSEGDYRKCHRALLIAPWLSEHGHLVKHVLMDGSLAEHRNAAQSELGL